MTLDRGESKMTIQDEDAPPGSAGAHEGFPAGEIASGRPVMVDFYADWCGPCRTVAPILERLAKEYTGKVTLAKVDIDVEPEMAERYGVSSIPTVILFKDGQVQATLIGAAREAAYRAKLDAMLGDGGARVSP
jgi:thioredoxin